MDSFMLTASGHVGRVQGYGLDRTGRDCYRFSVATNFRFPEAVLWLQCSVYKQALLQLCLERGLLVGDHVLVIAERAELAAVVRGNQAKQWLNVQVSQMTFLTAPAIPQLERGEGFQSRELDNVRYRHEEYEDYQVIQQGA